MTRKNRKSEIVPIRFTEDQKSALETAAKQANKSVSDFIRDLAFRELGKFLADKGAIA